MVGAVIVAAGGSTRMSGADKLFATIGGRPLLAHALARFQESPLVERIVLVLSAANLERGRTLAAEFGIDKLSALCEGGPRRQDSVRLGLEALRQGSGQALGPSEWVLVHDGARPLVTTELIERGLAAARETGAAVPAVPVADTVKQTGPEGTVERTLDRKGLWTAQTPQVFRYDLLLRAHREVTAEVTDDAAMLEALGLPVKLFEGSPTNIKVTTPEDLRMAEALLEAGAASVKGTP